MWGMSNNKLGDNMDSKLPNGSNPKSSGTDPGKALEQMKDAIKEPTLADSFKAKGKNVGNSNIGQGKLNQKPATEAPDEAKDSLKDKSKQVGKKVLKEASKPAAKSGAATLGGNVMMGAMNQVATAGVGLFAAIIGAIVDGVIAIGAFLGGLVMGLVSFSVWVVTGVIATVATAVTLVTMIIFQTDQVQRARAADEAFRCNDKNVADRAKQKISSAKKGELSAEDEARIDENSKKTLSVLSAYGLDETQIAAVLGCWNSESSIQPKRYETDYIVKDKYDLLDKDGPTAETLVGGWGAFLAMYGGGGLNEQGYLHEGKHYIGIGLGQWTGPRAKQLWDFSKSINKSMFDMDTQLGFMISDNDSGKSRLDAFKEASKGKSVDEATSLFLSMWEGVPGNKLGDRQSAAAERLIAIKKMSKDEEYAKSILSLANVKASAANNKQAKLNAKDDCGVALKDSGVVDYAEDGTGEFPAGVKGTMWLPEELPKELKAYAHDPKKYGLSWSSSHGWAEGSGQCVDFTESSAGCLWENGARVMQGHGKDQSSGWAKAFGTKLSKDPIKAGAIWSTPGPDPRYGHTGIVSHIFKNRDILVIEQNYAGLTGADGHKPNTWSYRYVKKAEYEAEGMTFAAPKEGKAKWDAKSGAKSSKK